MSTASKVRWWKVVATLLCEDIPDDNPATFYMRSAKQSTARVEVKETMLAHAYTQYEYGAYDVSIDSIVEVPQPPDGALYQMVATSELF
jgi:hypothetical protein